MLVEECTVQKMRMGQAGCTYDLINREDFMTRSLKEVFIYRHGRRELQISPGIDTGGPLEPHPSSGGV